ncbi:MAG: phosphatase PAP2 family protein [Ignavibacteriales bacterium]
MVNILYIIIALFFLTKNIHAAVSAEADSLLPSADSLLTSADTLQFQIPALVSDSSAEPGQLSWHTMFSNIPHDYNSFFKKSTALKNLPVIAGFALATATLMLVDEPIWNSVHSYYKESQAFNLFTRYSVNLGDGRYHFLLAGVFAVYGFSAMDSRAITTASNIVEGLLSSGIMVQVIKRITGRESPAAATKAAGEWRLFPDPGKYHRNQPRYYAFPSGHVTTAMTTVTILANNYPEVKWIKPIGYSLIGCLGAGLMGKGMHWLSDFPLALALGYTFGNIIAPEKSGKAGRGIMAYKEHISVIPIIDKSSFAMALIYKL